MPRTGFEPARLAALPPQSSASASSATWAILRRIIRTFFGLSSSCSPEAWLGISLDLSDQSLADLGARSGAISQPSPGPSLCGTDGACVAGKNTDTLHSRQRRG